MKTITFNKKALVNLPEVDDGIVAFQMVEYVIDFFGNEIRGVLDTKIMEDGRQFIIGGDGFIKDGTEIF